MPNRSSENPACDWNDPTGATRQETTGFLFRNARPSPATVQCDSCQKLVCDLHATGAQAAANYCTTCAKRLSKANPSVMTTTHTIPTGIPAGTNRGYGYFGPGYWGHS